MQIKLGTVATNQQAIQLMRLCKKVAEEARVVIRCELTEGSEIFLYYDAPDAMAAEDLKSGAYQQRQQAVSKLFGMVEGIMLGQKLEVEAQIERMRDGSPAKPQPAKPLDAVA